MLLHLRVKNLGVIGDAAIDPSPGFTVITGETGTGKTLLLGGLRLLLGGDARSTSPPSGDADAEVEGLIAVGDDEVGVRRVVPSGSRSRAYLDGNIASIEALTQQVAGHFEIVGQHDQHELTRPRKILDMVDAMLGPEGTQAKLVYLERWEELNRLRSRLAEFDGDPGAVARELDLHRFQAREIETAGLSPGMDERLRARFEVLSRHVEIADLVNRLIGRLDSINDESGHAVAAAREIHRLDDSASSMRSDVEELGLRAGELMADVARYANSLTYDEGQHREIEEQLNAIGDLKRKYGKTIEDVIAFGKEAERRVVDLEVLLEESTHLEASLATAQAEVEEAGRALSGARRAVASQLAAAALSQLADVGLDDAQLEVEVEAVDPTPNGSDRMSLRFASSARLEPLPIGRAASGGELSRLVLAMRLAAADSDANTLVFDEIDTGIGGQTAIAMGEKLASLARTTQVLCVTHLPQVAAHADRHYVVERGTGGPATVRRVADDDRVAELTRMIGSLPDSEAGRVAAAEMLALASK